MLSNEECLLDRGMGKDWRCGCCSAPFYFSPIKDDIPHYIKLVELGLKK